MNIFIVLAFVLPIVGPVAVYFFLRARNKRKKAERRLYRVIGYSPNDTRSCRRLKATINAMNRNRNRKRA